MYNVNADQMAVACAAGWGRPIDLSDRRRRGFGRPQATGPNLTLARGEALIAAGIATGGMQAKLNAAHTALRQGVPQSRIAAGAAEGVLERILSGQDVGTRLISEEVTAS